eukprot:TRINITY_DN113939_c0_g1_i1.p1 TRINITY_DN113939_c0_g1~~TRINITY_DN113939_c0_g1_i1.p1  ORF type:complete len:209 (-),score=39.64 TRINITY_DN113939_c0_g1_i1:68-694(-)
MMIVNGHSGMGLLLAREASGRNMYPFITTVSKRGRPAGLGPESALVEAMVMGSTKHYMAKCDVSDPVAFHDLCEWGPPAEPSPPASLLAIDEVAARLRECMDTWGATMLDSVAKLSHEILAELKAAVKLVKAEINSSVHERQKADLVASRGMLEEREAEMMEALADVLVLASERGDSSSATLTSSEEEILAYLRKTWTTAKRDLTEGR